MLHRQVSKLAMYHAVQAFLNKTETSALPKYGARRAAFITLVNQIDELAAQQAQPTSGEIVDRNRAFAEATDAALIVASLARSYAEAGQLGDLAARMRIRPSHFSAARLPQRLQLAERIYDDVVPQAAALVAEGVTAEMLEDFRAKLDRAKGLLALPRPTLVAKQLATKQLLAVYREMDRFLESQLDPMLFALRRTDREAHAQYRLARRIINRAATYPPERVASAVSSPGAGSLPELRQAA